MKIKHFIYNLYRGINPLKYDEIADYLMTNTFKYFFSVILIGVIVLFIFSIPMIYNFRTTFESSVSKFSQLGFNATASLKEPIKYPEQIPLVVVDFSNNSKNYYSGLGPKIVLSKNEADFHFFGKNIVKYDMFKDVIANKEKISNFLFGVLLISIPGMLMLAYGTMWVFYFALIIAIAIIGFLFSRLARFEISFSSCFKIGVFSSTVIIILNSILWPLNVQTYFLQYGLWIVFFIIGVSRSGSRVQSKSYGKRGKKGKAMDDNEWIQIRES